MKIGNTDISKLYIGSTEVTKAYLGSTVVYESGGYRAVPLTFEVISGGTITWKKAGSSATNKTIEYCKNGGAWTSVTASDITGTSITVNAGDVIQFRGNNSQYATNYFPNACKFDMTAKCYVYGNIMSLINATDFANLTTLSSANTFTGLFHSCSNLYNNTKPLLLPATTLTNSCYSNMFQGCTGLTTAPELPATTLASNCYTTMFFGCTSLTQAPALPVTTLATGCYQQMFNGCSNLVNAPELPATTLTDWCYTGMFSNCTSLTTAPALPATTLTPSCYNSMFSNCTSLTTAPELPATTLASHCYGNMFYNCTNLTTAPELPSTTLASGCYSYMFYGCTSLTTAPALPATTLASGCYDSMFYGCTNINYIKCLATDISASNCTLDWVDGVQTNSGTFIKASSTTWSTGTDGVPSGWTILNYDEQYQIQLIQNDGVDTVLIGDMYGYYGDVMGLEGVDITEELFLQYNLGQIPFLYNGSVVKSVYLGIIPFGDYEFVFNQNRGLYELIINQ